MVALIMLLVGVPPIVAAGASAISAALNIAAKRINAMTGPARRWSAWLVYLAAAGGASWAGAAWAIGMLPDFRTLGDGGVGMALNGIARVAISLAVPAAIFTAGSRALPSA